MFDGLSSSPIVSEPDNPKAATEMVHVIFGGGIVLAAYKGHAGDSAELHKRVITGATMVTVELLERVPAEVLADLEIEFAGEDEDDTPVQPRTLTVEDFDDAVTPKPE